MDKLKFSENTRDMLVHGKVYLNLGLLIQTGNEVNPIWFRKFKVSGLYLDFISITQTKLQIYYIQENLCFFVVYYFLMFTVLSGNSRQVPLFAQLFLFVRVYRLEMHDKTFLFFPCAGGKPESTTEISAGPGDCQFVSPILDPCECNQN